MNKFNWEVGKKFVRRDGQIVTVVERWDLLDDSRVCYCTEYVNPNTPRYYAVYRSTGKYSPDEVETKLDIICEYVEPKEKASKFNWEVGKKFVTRSGNIVTVERLHPDKDGAVAVVFFEEGHPVYADGFKSNDHNYSSPNDIICEYKGAGPDHLYLKSNDPNSPDYMKVSDKPVEGFKNSLLDNKADNQPGSAILSPPTIIFKDDEIDESGLGDGMTYQAEDEHLDEEEPDRGTKFDAGKPMFACLPPHALLELGKVAELGARKYGMHNFRRGIEVTRTLDAAFRHLIKATAGEDVDPDDGNNHLVSAAWNMLVAFQTLKEHPELDNRYKHIDKHK